MISRRIFERYVFVLATPSSIKSTTSLPYGQSKMYDSEFLEIGMGTFSCFSLKAHSFFPMHGLAVIVNKTKDDFSPETFGE